MEIIIKPDAHAAARLAARKIASLVRKKPDAVLGLATGRTPLETYERLAEIHRAEELDFSRVTGSLDRHCRENGIACHPFDTFKDVQVTLEQLLNPAPVRRYRQAVVAVS